MSAVVIVGIDVATQERNTGIALGRLSGRHLSIEQTELGSAAAPVVPRIVDWLEGAASALLAFDAPLGWPSALPRELAAHQAGESLHSCADDLFSRATDRDIRRRFGKRPLEVGADRIARTAHTALRILADLRAAIPDVPLAWAFGIPSGTVAIEVYPAVTKLGHAIQIEGTHLHNLPPWVTISSSVALNSEHVRDAVLCGIAAADFILGDAIAPDDEMRTIAMREGWIWAKGSRASTGVQGDADGYSPVRQT